MFFSVVVHTRFDGTEPVKAVLDEDYSDFIYLHQEAGMGEMSPVASVEDIFTPLSSCGE